MAAITGVLPEDVGRQQVRQHGAIGRNGRRGHIIANAAPVCSVWIAVVFSQARYGAAAANIAGDDGPYQAELISSPNHES